MANYNGYPITAEAIASLKKLSYSNFKIVVVDDCSKDDSMEQFRRHNQNEIILLQNAVNSGLCTTYNTGIKRALQDGADYVFIVQNDTKDFSVNYLEEVIKKFESDTTIGMVGSIIYNGAGEMNWAETKTKFGFPLDISEGLVIKAEVFKTIGLLNEKLKVYFEDLDFIIRMRAAGYRTAKVTHISFVHYGQRTFSKQRFLPHFIRVRNVPLFMRRYCKQQSFAWKLRHYQRYMRVHIQSLLKALKRWDLVSACALFNAVLIGTLVGLFTPWSDELEHGYHN